MKANNPQLFYVIDMLMDAIQEKKKVRFQYGEFDADRQRILRNDGEIYINSPYGCLWCDEFYYLDGYSEKRAKVVTFRVDRIVDLEIMDELIIPEPDGFKMSDYAKVIIEIFDGEKQDVELICDNAIMKNVIDKFGEDIRTERFSEEQFKATVNVSTSKTFYAWCFRFAGQMRIEDPENVRNEYRKMAQRVLG